MWKKSLISLFAMFGIFFISSCALNWDKSSRNISLINITSFRLDNLYSGTIAGRYIAVVVPKGTSVKAMVPEIKYTGASISPDTGVAQDFTQPVIYTVLGPISATQPEPSSEDYTVIVVEETEIRNDVVSGGGTPEQLSSSNDILVFAMDDQLCSTANSENEIVCSVSFSTDVTTISPVVIVSSKATISPASGQSTDFSSGAVDYTVTAEDGSIKMYSVSVRVSTPTDKDILAFRIGSSAGIIDEGVEPATITLTVPYDTDVETLTPIITKTGVSVSPESGVSHDFTSPVDFTVTAQDTSTKIYRVTVTKSTPPASIPEMSPASGMYASDQSVTITSSDSADIYYTIDGTTPAVGVGSTAHYTTAIPVAGDGTFKTIKAIAVKSGMTTSSVVSNSYSINYAAVSMPTMSLASGTYSSDQSVTITSSDSADIYYTIDGTTPAVGVGSTARYTTAIPVAGDGTFKTIKVIAVKSGMTTSSVVSNSYSINYAAVSMPTMSLASGTYSSDQSVTISTTTASADIYYTIDGTTPTTSKTHYTGDAISVAGDGTFKTIKAIAVKSGMTNSSVATSTYTILYSEVSSAPTISPASGSYFSAFNVTITSANPSADIYYTTDNSTPTEGGGSSTHYTVPIPVSGNTAVTIKAKAFYSSHNITSSVATASYTLFVAGGSTAFDMGGVSFNMIGVPGGLTTLTGTTDNGTATVANAYQIGQTEVTYNLWRVVRVWAQANKGYTFGNLGREGSTGTIGAAPITTGQPATMISWRDAMVWMNALTEYYNATNGSDPDYTCAYYQSDGTTPIRISTTSTTITASTPGSQDAPYVLTGATGFRLPSSNEWELAARYKDGTNWTPGSYASGATAAYTDVTATGLVAWHSVSATHVVQIKAANALSLYDMSGNVWEWNFDWYTSGSYRVIRGGDWLDGADYVRVGLAYNSIPYTTRYDIGFRVARTTP